MLQGTLTEGKGSVRLTSLYLLVWISSFLHWKYYLFTFLTKQATLLRRSIVLSPPLQLVFTGWSIAMLTVFYTEFRYSDCRNAKFTLQSVIMQRKV